MKVLSIDLDYIMNDCIQEYQTLHFHNNPSIRWNKLYKETNFKPYSLLPNKEKLFFCYEIFLKNLLTCKKVCFGYDHDSILFDLEKFDNIQLTNIDHHNDVFHVDGSIISTREIESYLESEYNAICNLDHVCEGNWIAWLYSNHKLKSCEWIYNENSDSIELKSLMIQKLLGDSYKIFLQKEYNFDDSQFDYMFVCLSPQYVPPECWHYFGMFMKAYEHITGKLPDLISNKKFEHTKMFNNVNSEVFYRV